MSGCDPKTFSNQTLLRLKCKSNCLFFYFFLIWIFWSHLHLNASCIMHRRQPCGRIHSRAGSYQGLAGYSKVLTSVFFFSEEDVLIHSMSNGMVKKHVSKIRSDISEHIRVTNGNVTLLKPFVKYRHTMLIAEVFRAIHSVFWDPKNVS